MEIYYIYAQVLDKERQQFIDFCRRERESFRLIPRRVPTRIEKVVGRLKEILDSSNSKPPIVIEVAVSLGCLLYHYSEEWCGHQFFPIGFLYRFTRGGGGRERSAFYYPEEGEGSKVLCYNSGFLSTPTLWVTKWVSENKKWNLIPQVASDYDETLLNLQALHKGGIEVPAAVILSGEAVHQFQESPLPGLQHLDIYSWFVRSTGDWAENLPGTLLMSYNMDNNAPTVKEFMNLLYRYFQSPREATPLKGANLIGWVNPTDMLKTENFIDWVIKNEIVKDTPEEILKGKKLLPMKLYDFTPVYPDFKGEEKEQLQKDCQNVFGQIHQEYQEQVKELQIELEVLSRINQSQKVSFSEMKNNLNHTHDEIQKASLPQNQGEHFEKLKEYYKECDNAYENFRSDIEQKIQIRFSAMKRDKLFDVEGNAESAELSLPYQFLYRLLFLLKHLFGVKRFLNIQLSKLWNKWDVWNRSRENILWLFNKLQIPIHELNFKVFDRRLIAPNCWGPTLSTKLRLRFFPDGLIQRVKFQERIPTEIQRKDFPHPDFLNEFLPTSASSQPIRRKSMRHRARSASSQPINRDLQTFLRYQGASAWEINTNICYDFDIARILAYVDMKEFGKAQKLFNPGKFQYYNDNQWEKTIMEVFKDMLNQNEIDYQKLRTVHDEWYQSELKNFLENIRSNEDS